MPNHDIRAAADQSATGRNTTAMPTPAQLAAGNYRKGRVSIHGLSIAIENPIGTFREGVGADGKPWRTRMAADYGYFAGTRGADGDGVDVFVGDFIDSGDVWVINQIDPATGAFDEHKVMLGFGSEALARAAYTESYDHSWKGLGSMVRITVPQLRWWLKRGSMLSPLEDAGSLPAMPASGSMLQPVRWSADAEPVGKSLGRVLYEMQLDDVGDDLLTDPMTMADLLTDPDITSHMVLDALVSEVGMLQHRAEQLMSVMQAAGRAVKPQQLEVGEPVRLRGTMQVPVIFGMSDGQTLSIWFHNPDTTPAKLTPMDTLVSARWLINKKDVTIAVAPEKGQDLKPREVARRIMALIEKNSAAFARANAKAAETAQKIDGLKAEIDGLQAELAGLNEKIARAEAVRVDRAAKAKAVPVDPTKEAEQPPAIDEPAGVPAMAGDNGPAPLAPEGAESKVKTAKGTEVLTGYSVIEADRLITSHDPATGDANPAFPPELQPRDRGRDASIAWVRKTAQDLDPDLLGKSRRADSGAPIVGPDGVVESGNGRTMAVVLAYQTGKADDYRAWLESEASYFGLSPEKVKGMRRPVLVRVRTSQVDRAAFAVEANQDDKLAMTATEVAKADANRLTDDVVALMTEDGDLTAAANVPFLAAFLRTLGDAEAARYSTSDGKPTASLIARVQAAIFAKAYQDDRLLELTADVAKPEIANIVKALNHAAPEFIQAAALDPAAAGDATGKLTDAVEKSLNQKSVDALLGASNVIRQAKEAGQTVDEFVKQSGLFGDIDPDAAAMAVFISKNSRSAKRMGEAFKAMAVFIKGELQRRQTADMFGDGEPVDFKDIVAAANRELERMYGPGVETIGLFDRRAGAEDSSPPAPAAGVPIIPESTDQVEPPTHPDFASYAEAMDWVRAKSKAAGSQGKFTSSDEYKAAYPAIKALADEESEEAKSALVARFNASGHKVGDRVTMSVLGSFLSTETHAGYIAMHGGWPSVILDAPMTISRGGRVRAVSRINWSEAWKTETQERQHPVSEQASSEPDRDPIAIVDAAYRFDDATDDFKSQMADSVDDADYSEFATAKAIDQAVKAHGGTVSWSLVAGAILDSADGPDDEPDDGDEAGFGLLDGVLILDGDFKGHPFRGNQYSSGSSKSSNASRASREAKRAERKAGGHDRVMQYVHSSAAHAHKQAAKGAKGKTRTYHAKMAKFHAQRAAHHQDKIDGKMVLDSAALAAFEAEAWPDAALTVMDSAAGGDPQGVIRAGGKVLGRAVIGSDGKAMIYVGAKGKTRVTNPSGATAVWGEYPSVMVEGLFAAKKKPAKAAAIQPATPTAEPAASTMTNDTPAAAPAPSIKKTIGSTNVGDFIPKIQLATMLKLERGEEGQFFRDKVKDLADQIASMPATYGQDGKGDQAVAHLHYFSSGADWYITEKDMDGGVDQAFGLADLGDGGELGYISIRELTALAGVELDLHWSPKTLGEIRGVAPTIAASPVHEPPSVPAADSAPEPKDMATAMQMAADAARAAGIELSEWKASSAKEWSYATATIGDTSVSFGTSTGGIVSINGNPFTPTGRKPNDNPAAVAESVQALVTKLTPEQPPEPEPSSTTTPMPVNPPANPARTDDLAYLRAIIDGKSPDMLEPDTADKLIAIMERHGDAEAQDLAGRAIDAYQSAAMEATAGIR